MVVGKVEGGELGAVGETGTDVGDDVVMKVSVVIGITMKKSNVVIGITMKK